MLYLVHWQKTYCILVLNEENIKALNVSKEQGQQR